MDRPDRVPEESTGPSTPSLMYSQALALLFFLDLTVPLF